MIKKVKNNKILINDVSQLLQLAVVWLWKYFA